MVKGVLCFALSVYCCAVYKQQRGDGYETMIVGVLEKYRQDITSYDNIRDEVKSKIERIVEAIRGKES